MMIRYSWATGRTRTGDPRITNALLYQLSHNGKSFAIDDDENHKCACKSTAFLRNMQIFLRICSIFCNFVAGINRNPHFLQSYCHMKIRFFLILLTTTMAGYAQHITQTINPNIRTLRTRFLSEALEPSGTVSRPYLVLPMNGVIDGGDVENTLFRWNEPRCPPIHISRFALQ